MNKYDEVEQVMMRDDPELRGLLWFLLGGTRGGQSRARIVDMIRERPWNVNQLASQLGLQYKAVQHHVKVLQRSSLVIPSGGKYGTVYSLSPWMSGHMEIFDEICAKLRFEIDRRPGQP